MDTVRGYPAWQTKQRWGGHIYSHGVAAPEDVSYGLDLAGLDPASLTEALAGAGLQLAREPAKAARAFGGLALAQSAVALRSMRQVLGGEVDGIVGLDRDERRFGDRAWRDNPFLRALLESYLAGSDATMRTLESLELSETRRRKAKFAAGIVLDALAPTNVPWLNPTVLKEAVDTGGGNFVRGFANFLDDAVHHGGLPREVDPSAFELGRDLAATKGRVVLRNDLMELLAYEPRTTNVLAEPLVYCPSWINKYYVLDLAPGRSFIEHAVDRGFTVFTISWRNPDSTMAGVTLDDYLREGLLTAVDRASELTGSPKVNVLGVCIGGTLAMIALALLAGRGEGERIGWTTLLNTLVDYADPGEIGSFTDERTIERIERRMARRGYLEGSDLSRPFTWMKGNELVWRNVISNWYLGKQPPAFDVLAWNADSTRLPAAMHGQFLRACYLDNRLVEPGAFLADGTPIDVGTIHAPLYVLASENDHIAPWRSVYRTTQLVGGDAHFVLSSGGHIVGMVNPPGGAGWYRTQDGTPADPGQWLAGTERVQGSWWEHWAAWAEERSGNRVEPPVLPEGDPAPGSYVRG